MGWEQRWTQLLSWDSITRESWECGSAQHSTCVPAHVCTSLRSSIGHSSGPRTSRAICTSTKQRRIPAGSASPEPPFLITVIVALASSGAGCSPWLQIQREESGPWGRTGKGSEPPGIPSGSCGGTAAAGSQTQQGPSPARARPFRASGAFQGILPCSRQVRDGKLPWCCWDRARLLLEAEFGMFGAAEQLTVPEELEETPFPGDGHGRAPGLWHRRVAERGLLPWYPHPVSRGLLAGSAHFPSPRLPLGHGEATRGLFLTMAGLPQSSCVTFPRGSPIPPRGHTRTQPPLWHGSQENAAGATDPTQHLEGIRPPVHLPANLL